MKLHLGCGKRYIPGYTHIDQSKFDHIDHCHPIEALPFIDSDHVDEIYACHVLSYFDRDQVQNVLKEWHRVLKQGATLRLAVPDFEALIQVYQQSKELDRCLGPLYGKMPMGEDAQWIYHKTVYDFTSLKQLLEQCGFSQVQNYDWRKTPHQDVDDFSQAYYPHMDKENGLLISLNVEAIKV